MRWILYFPYILACYFGELLRYYSNHLNLKVKCLLGILTNLHLPLFGMCLYDSILYLCCMLLPCRWFQIFFDTSLKVWLCDFSMQDFADRGGAILLASCLTLVVIGMVLAWEMLRESSWNALASTRCAWLFLVGYGEGAEEKNRAEGAMVRERQLVFWQFLRSQKGDSKICKMFASEDLNIGHGQSLWVGMIIPLSTGIPIEKTFTTRLMTFTIKVIRD